VRLILDTHAIFWSLEEPSRVSAVAMIAMADSANDRLLSAATVWELAIKVGQGKLTLSLPYLEWIEKAITDLALTLLPVTVEYADRQSALPEHHKDPFDRMMIAQSLRENASKSVVIDLDNCL
jgi:PIN domain nuclease of toxin-antitoxin system